MRQSWNKIKKIAIGIGAVAIAVLFVIGLSSAMKKQNQQLCKNVEIELDYSDGLGFVDEERIRASLIKHELNTLAGQPIHDINLSAIEKQLNEDPFVRETEVYSNTIGDVIIKVSQKEPIIRLINKNRVSFYLTENKELMPLTDIFTVRLLVVSGNIASTADGIAEEEQELFDKLLRLTHYINSDPFWSAMITQVNVDDEDDFTLLPILGKHKIEFGDIDDDMESKFGDLKTLYKEGMKYTGWSQYKKINLKFDNQIVCTKH